MTIERRYVTEVVTVRSQDGQPPRMVGYALKFNRLSQNLGGFVERVAPGAVAKSLGDRLDVLARYQHADEYLLGRVSAGTLRLAADDTGLQYEVDLPDTSYGRDLAVLAGRGDVRHSSFAFTVPPGGDSWDTTEDGFPLRTLNQIRLIDVAPVVQPAYLDTTSGLRSLAEARGLDLTVVTEAARTNQLAAIVRGDTPTTGEPQGQREPHPDLVKRRLQLLRQQLTSKA